MADEDKAAQVSDFSLALWRVDHFKSSALISNYMRHDHVIWSTKLASA